MRFGGISGSLSCVHFGPFYRNLGVSGAVDNGIGWVVPPVPTIGPGSVPDYLTSLGDGIRGKRIGIADAYLRQHVDPAVQAVMAEALDVLQDLGAELVEISLPAPTDAVPALLAILMPEATAYHLPWLRSYPEKYSSAVRERLELGAVTPAVSYIQAQQARRQITEGFLAAMRKADVDLLVTPTGPTPATPLEGDLVTGDEADPDVLAALINFTGPFDLTGFPAISIPAGFTPGGLPIGLQLVARPWQEAPLLAAAHAYEQVTDWHTRLPRAVS
jgi:aspartyl-tRNA(Asn)/glutamyl-tRNA(Gln) amidotransferase subunit A